MQHATFTHKITTNGTRITTIASNSLRFSPKCCLPSFTSFYYLYIQTVKYKRISGITSHYYTAQCVWYYYNNIYIYDKCVICVCPVKRSGDNDRLSRLLQQEPSEVFAKKRRGASSVATWKRKRCVALGVISRRRVTHTYTLNETRTYAFVNTNKTTSSNLQEGLYSYGLAAIFLSTLSSHLH